MSNWHTTTHLKEGTPNWGRDERIDWEGEPMGIFKIGSSFRVFALTEENEDEKIIIIIIILYYDQ